MENFPNLETSRLWLRQATEADTDAIFSLFSDSRVTRFHNLDVFTQLDEAKAVIERRRVGFETDRGIRWAIALKPNNSLIGSCGFTWDRALNRAEVGYELASQYWRQGIMTEGLSAILTYGFEVEGLDNIVAEVMLENIASQQLLKKLGFQSQGVLKNHGFWKGRHHDLEQFLLLRPQT
ncbi:MULTISPECIES: GNAT family N-acetyltransferase [Cyanophyceae]|uniref:GNAT family N-acetyltransferase n=1 Tax=Leptolyngbya subtilissima DQ-A4 TaxID=2933933 RepID=A0ABV0K088_9CYAN|nr:GNAT family N-acetyltransferase [Nodosilinea sp. FACHB-141]MBD2110973.1 GNAT family N-acetyltransferase [Nodosilinea sp. FACHB-141]